MKLWICREHQLTGRTHCSQRGFSQCDHCSEFEDLQHPSSTKQWFVRAVIVFFAIAALAGVTKKYLIAPNSITVVEFTVPLEIEQSVDRTRKGDSCI